MSGLGSKRYNMVASFKWSFNGCLSYFAYSNDWRREAGGGRVGRPSVQRAGPGHAGRPGRPPAGCRLQ